MYAKYFILVDSFCYAIGNERKAWERYWQASGDAADTVTTVKIIDSHPFNPNF